MRRAAASGGEICAGCALQQPLRYDRGTPIDGYCIERFLGEHAERIHGEVLEVKDANYSRRFSDEVRCHVVDIDPKNTEADLHADLNIPGSLPAEFSDCVILTQVVQFLAPEQALRNIWASVAPGGTLLVTVPTLGRLDPHHQATDFWRWTPGGLEELDVIDSYFPLVACAHADKPA
jgi:SAM-dependent methyltransferase